MGIILMLIYAYRVSNNLFIPSIIFIIAALGGMYLSSKDFTGKTVPKSVAIIHAGIALLGGFILIMLLIQ